MELLGPNISIIPSWGQPLIEHVTSRSQSENLTSRALSHEDGSQQLIIIVLLFISFLIICGASCVSFNFSKNALFLRIWNCWDKLFQLSRVGDCRGANPWPLAPNAITMSLDSSPFDRDGCEQLILIVLQFIFFLIWFADCFSNNFSKKCNITQDVELLGPINSFIASSGQPLIDPVTSRFQSENLTSRPLSFEDGCQQLIIIVLQFTSFLIICGAYWFSFNFSKKCNIPENMKLLWQIVSIIPRWGQSGSEPVASRTQRDNHDARPLTFQ